VFTGTESALIVCRCIIFLVLRVYNLVFQPLISTFQLQLANSIAARSETDLQSTSSPLRSRHSRVVAQITFARTLAIYFIYLPIYV
jgi:hypothetical protein